MSRHLLLPLVMILAVGLMLGCGGINNNPTSPGFQNPNQQTPAGQQPGGVPAGLEGLMGQLSGGGASTGEQVIQGNFETLWPQGLQNLENGQGMLAGQYFKSAFAQNPQSAEAALAYALSDVMRDYRRFAVFLHPGVDRLFMSTPLIGHPEVFPNAFLTEDSYMLRLAALGCRSAKLVPTVKYSVIAPLDSNAVFTPDNYQRFKQVSEGSTPTPPASGAGPGIPGGTPDQGQPSAGRGDLTGGGGNNGTNRVGGGVQKHQGGKQGGTGLGPQRPGSGTTLPGASGTIGQPGIGGPPAGAPSVPLPEREEPFSESEWTTMITEYRDSAARDGADIFPSSIFYSNLQMFHDEIKEHITNLEAIKTLAEADGFSLALSMNVTDGTKKMTLTFDKDDYHLILDHYKLMDSLLSYVEAYDNTVAYALPTLAPVDKNTDSKLSPDEYLPPAPFGTLKTDGKDVLSAQLPIFLQTLSGLDSTIRPLLNSAQQVQAGDAEPKRLFYLSSFHANFVLIEQWVDSLRDLADKSTSGTTIKLDSAAGVSEAVAVYDALFSSPLEDVRTPLPTYDAVTFEPVLDEDGNWSSDPTFGGFFAEGFEDIGTYLKSGRLTCTVYDTQMAKAKGDKLVVGLKDGEVGENGLVSIDTATVNELIGTEFQVMGSDRFELGKGVLKSLSEVIPLFDMKLLTSLFGTPVLGGFTTNVGSNGGMTIGPGGPAGPAGPGGPGQPGGQTTPPGASGPVTPAT